MNNIGKRDLLTELSSEIKFVLITHVRKHKLINIESFAERQSMRQ